MTPAIITLAAVGSFTLVDLQTHSRLAIQLAATHYLSTRIENYNVISTEGSVSRKSILLTKSKQISFDSWPDSWLDKFTNVFNLLTWAN
jgi:hypothetical protein